MSALRSVKRLIGSAIRATDGPIGKAIEFYFDDGSWAIRYLVVDVGSWLWHKTVLLSTQSLGPYDAAAHVIPAAVTRDQVRHSPKTDTDMPIALQLQAQLHQHYGWEFYWGAEALIGSSDPNLISPKAPLNADGKPFDPRLRTTRVVEGHQAQALDGHAGHIEDFLLDEGSWTLRNAIVRLDDGRCVAVPTSWVRRIRFEESTVYLDAPLEKIRACPPVAPSFLMEGEEHGLVAPTLRSH